MLGGKLDRMDENLEGVAYRRDIEPFVAREEIERRNDKAVDGANAEAALGLAQGAGVLARPSAGAFDAALYCSLPTPGFRSWHKANANRSPAVSQAPSSTRQFS
jgi:hypothetical protein